MIFNIEIKNVSRTIRGGHVEEIHKPNVVLDYIKHMGDIDRADHYAASYCFWRKSLIWWRKLFFWGICAVNSYILYKEICKEKNEKPITHLQFVKKLVIQLRGDFRLKRKVYTI